MEEHGDSAWVPAAVRVDEGLGPAAPITPLSTEQVLVRRVEDLKAQVRSLQELVHGASTKSSGELQLAMFELASAKDDLRAAERRVEAQRTKLEETAGRARSLQEQLEASRQREVLATETGLKASSELKGVQEELKVLQQEALTAKEEQKRLSGNLARAQAELRTTTTQRDQAVEALRAGTGERGALQAQLRDLEAKRKTDVGVLQANVDALQTQLRDQQLGEKAVRQQLAEAAKREATLHERATELQGRVQSLQSEVAAAARERTELVAKTTALSESLEKAVAQLATATARAEAAEAEQKNSVATQQRLVEAARADASLWIAKATASEAKVLDTMGELTVVQAQLASVQTELAATVEARDKALADRGEAATAAAADVEARIEDLKGAMLHLRADKEALQTANATLRAELRGVTVAAEVAQMAHVAQLQAANNSIELRLKRNKTLFDSLEASNAQVRNEKRDALRELHAIQAQLEALKGANAKLTAALHANQASEAASAQVLEQQRVQAQRTQEQLQLLQNDLAEQEARAASQETAHVKQARKLRVQQAVLLAAMKGQRVQTEEVRADLVAANERSLREQETLQREIADTRAEAARVHSAHARLQQELGVKQRELQDMEARQEALAADMARVAEVAAAEKTVSLSQMEALAAEHTRLQTDMDSTASAARAARGDAVASERRLQALQAEFDALQAHMQAGAADATAQQEAMQGQMGRLQEEHERTVAQVAKLEHTLQEERVLRSSLELAVAAKAQDLQAQVRAQRDLQQQVALLRAATDGGQRTIEELTESLRLTELDLKDAEDAAEAERRTLTQQYNLQIQQSAQRAAEDQQRLRAVIEASERERASLVAQRRQEAEAFDKQLSAQRVEAQQISLKVSALETEKGVALTAIHTVLATLQSLTVAAGNGGGDGGGGGGGGGSGGGADSGGDDEHAEGRDRTQADLRLTMATLEGVTGAHVASRTELLQALASAETGLAAVSSAYSDADEGLISRVQETVRAVSAVISVFRDKLQLAVSETAALLQGRTELTTELQVARERLNQAGRDHGEQLRTLTAGFQGEVAALAAELATAVEARTAGARQVAALLLKQSELQEGLAGAVQQQAALQSRIRDMETDARSASSAHTRELTSLERQRDGLQADLETRQAGLDRVSRDLAASLGALARMRDAKAGTENLLAAVVNPYGRPNVPGMGMPATAAGKVLAGLVPNYLGVPQTVFYVQHQVPLGQEPLPMVVVARKLARVDLEGTVTLYALGAHRVAPQIVDTILSPIDHGLLASTRPVPVTAPILEAGSAPIHTAWAFGGPRTSDGSDHGAASGDSTSDSAATVAARREALQTMLQRLALQQPGWLPLAPDGDQDAAHAAAKTAAAAAYRREHLELEQTAVRTALRKGRVQYQLKPKSMASAADRACLDFLAQAKCSREPGDAGVLRKQKEWLGVTHIPVASAASGAAPREYALLDPITDRTLKVSLSEGVPCAQAVAEAVLMVDPDAGARTSSWDLWLQRQRRQGVALMSPLTVRARAAVPFIVSGVLGAAASAALVYSQRESISRAWKAYKVAPPILRRSRALVAHSSKFSERLQSLMHGAGVGSAYRTRNFDDTALASILATAVTELAVGGEWRRLKSFLGLHLVNEINLVETIACVLLGVACLVWFAYGCAKASAWRMSPTSHALARACATLATEPVQGVGVFQAATFGVYPATVTRPGDAEEKGRVDHHNTMQAQGLLGVLEMKWTTTTSTRGGVTTPTPTVALPRRPAWMWRALQWGTEQLLGKEWADLAATPAALFTKGGVGLHQRHPTAVTLPKV
jgi:chromosome segregation ATPase